MLKKLFIIYKRQLSPLIEADGAGRSLSSFPLRRPFANQNTHITGG